MISLSAASGYVAVVEGARASEKGKGYGQWLRAVGFCWYRHSGCVHFVCGWMDGCKHLVSRVVAGHVTLSTVDAHLFIYESLHLLLVVQLLVCSNVLQSSGYHILTTEDK